MVSGICKPCCHNLQRAAGGYGDLDFGELLAEMETLGLGIDAPGLYRIVEGVKSKQDEVRGGGGGFVGGACIIYKIFEPTSLLEMREGVAGCEASDICAISDVSSTTRDP
eukprot:1156838-Pelagomonas_calceolata.AAC.1